MRERQGEQKITRPGAHGRQIAGGARQGLVAHGSRWMDAPQKMHVFEKRVGRDDPFGACAWAYDRGIIPDTGTEPVFDRRELPAYPFDQLVFTGHQYSCPERLRHALIDDILGHEGAWRYGCGLYLQPAGKKVAGFT